MGLYLRLRKLITCAFIIIAVLYLVGVYACGSLAILAGTDGIAPLFMGCIVGGMLLLALSMSSTRRCLDFAVAGHVCLLLGFGAVYGLGPAILGPIALAISVLNGACAVVLTLLLAERDDRSKRSRL